MPDRLSRASDLRRRLHGGEILLGAFLSTDSPVAAEICADAGFDWLMIDLEHGVGTIATVLDSIRAIESYGTPILVRPGTLDRPTVSRLLDQGIDGFIYPRIDTAEQVAELVALTRYPPRGQRGVAVSGRIYRFGADAERVAEMERHDRVNIVQIETAQGLDNVDSIARTDGVDGLFVGPSDLSSELGIYRQFDDPRYQEALDRILAAARAADISAGGLALDPAAVAELSGRGMTVLQVGSDTGYLAAGARRALVEGRAAVASE